MLVGVTRAVDAVRNAVLGAHACPGSECERGVACSGPDERELAASGEQSKRLLHQRRLSDHLECVVQPATLGGLPDGVGGVLGSRNVRGAASPGVGTPLGAGVDRDDRARAGEPSAADDLEPHAAGAPDRDPLTGDDGRRPQGGADAGGDGTADEGDDLAWNPPGQGHDGTGRDDDVVGEAADVEQAIEWRPIGGASHARARGRCGGVAMLQSSSATAGHTSHGARQASTTRVPTDGAITPAPTASTMPAPSWPSSNGTVLASPTAATSVWQMPAAVILTRTSPGPGASTSRLTRWGAAPCCSRTRPLASRGSDDATRSERLGRGDEPAGRGVGDLPILVGGGFDAARHELLTALEHLGPSRR
jgi:hypothetical protein